VEEAIKEAVDQSSDSLLLAGSTLFQTNTIVKMRMDKAFSNSRLENRFHRLRLQLLRHLQLFNLYESQFYLIGDKDFKDCDSSESSVEDVE